MNYLCENEMLPVEAAVERLEHSAKRAGLSPDDLIDLLQNGMDLEHVISYVAAVLNRQVN